MSIAYFKLVGPTDGQIGVHDHLIFILYKVLL